MNKLLIKLLHYKNFFLSLLVLGLFGYTVFQISQITKVAPDSATVEAQIATRNAASIKLNTKALDALSNTLTIPVDANPGDTGKADPFNP